MMILGFDKIKQFEVLEEITDPTVAQPYSSVCITEIIVSGVDLTGQYRTVLGFLNEFSNSLMDQSVMIRKIGE